MTEQPVAYPDYATPTFRPADAGRAWVVFADPWQKYVGWTDSHSAVGWTAYTPKCHYVGLYPDKQAAGEALVRHAGYEVLTQ